MKNIIVASQNPVKIQAVLEGFENMFPGKRFNVRGIEVDSGVSDQPKSDTQTLKGAENRTRIIMKSHKGADYFVGIEGGVEEKGGQMYTFAWVVIRGKKLLGKGRTAAFPLPLKVIARIKNGKELGDAMDEIFGKTNSKQKEGAIGILTDGVIDRKALYTPAVISALIPFIKKDLYHK